MAGKTDFIHCRLSTNHKKKLKAKAEALGIDLTAFLEKIADEDIVFLDSNVTKLLGAVLTVKR